MISISNLVYPLKQNAIKKDKFKTLTVQFTEIRSAIYHLSKGLDDSKGTAKP